MSGSAFPRGLPVALWPDVDRTAWEAVVPTLAPRTARGARLAYGRLLAWCADESKLVDTAAVKAYADAVRAARRPSTAHSDLKGLATALLQLRPGEPSGWAEMQRSKREALAAARGFGSTPRSRPSSTPRIEPFELWPVDERRRWHEALNPPLAPPPPPPTVGRYDRFLPGAGGSEPGVTTRDVERRPSDWRPATQRAALRGWGRWRAWCAALRRPLEVTPTGVRNFIDEAAARGCASHTMRQYAFELQMALRVLQPGVRRDWLARMVGALQEVARPRIDKAARLVPLADVLEMAYGLMHTAAAEPLSIHAAVRYRDGMLIALLLWRPKRVDNVAALSIGSSLRLDAHGKPVAMVFARTKNGKRDSSPLPDALIPFILVYLRTYRPLLDVEGRPELLLTEQGRAMTPRAIGHVFRTRTGNALGRAIGPHHVRTLYATDMASLSLEAAPAIRAMLGHSDPETLRHYLALGTSSLAARQLQDVTEKLRQGDAGYERSSRRRKVHAD